MTWVLGSGTLFGYGALIADVRVSWPGGQVADILQKIHGVAPNMMAGFAGSVRLGFSLVNDMRGCFARTDDALWWPRAAAWWWWRRARGIFRAAPLEEQKKGSAILLVGPGPDETQPWPRSYCVRMKGPDFHPEYLPSIVWHSIGSGRDHDAAKYFANDIKKLHQCLRSRRCSHGSWRRCISHRWLGGSKPAERPTALCQ